VAAASVAGFSAVAAGLTFVIKDLLCLIESIASAKQVIKNPTARNVVARVKNTFVLVPNMDSTPAKLSTSPAPLPLWIKTIKIKPTQKIA
jgi:hypothetical protein